VFIAGFAQFRVLRIDAIHVAGAVAKGSFLVHYSVADIHHISGLVWSW